MYLICGLGNPGKEFRFTRHNVGFLILDFFAKTKKFPKFKLKKELKSEISKRKIWNKTILLLKPQTFMNNSGKAVNLVVKKYKIPLKNLWIVHDDVTISFGKIKISFGKEAGGHKGVVSIIDALQAKDFFRLRVGIGPLPKGQLLKNFVLEKFSKGEKIKLKKILEKTLVALEISIKEKPERAMEIFNK